jgi:hypothetical protein
MERSFWDANEDCNYGLLVLASVEAVIRELLDVARDL